MIIRLFKRFARYSYYPDRLRYMSPVFCVGLGVLLAHGSQYGAKAGQFSATARELFLMIGLVLVLCGFVWTVNIYQMRILEGRELERTENDWIDLSENNE